ncbi:MAG TPA: TetR/AcrR family transcriptional regulator [Candidatus Onthovivens sp.]|mgnify:CR=1 FL=1|nr:TetR/AcrR family transcriptional regulator [Candidatus Onthovivens sp.]
MKHSYKENLKIKDKRRTDILDAALFLFVHMGKSAVSMDSISKRARCSHGLIYYYYNSKDAILEALRQDAEKVFKGQFEFIKKQGLEGLEFFKAFTKTVLDVIQQEEKESYYIALFLTSLLENEGHNNDKITNWLEQQVIKEQKRGIFEDGNARTYLLLYFTLLDGLTTRQIRTKNGLPNPDFRFIVNLFIKNEEVRNA